MLIASAIAFAAGTHPDKLVTLKTLGGSWSEGTKADFSSGTYRDTITKTVTTANDQDTTIFATLRFDRTKYTGFEIKWECTAVSSDTLAEDDTLFPMLWTSDDGSNWTVIPSTVNITADTMTHASDAATTLAIRPTIRRYMLTDASPSVWIGNWLRVGVRYAGANEDAATVNATWKVYMWKFKE